MLKHDRNMLKLASKILIHTNNVIKHANNILEMCHVKTNAKTVCYNVLTMLATC